MGAFSLELWAAHVRGVNWAISEFWTSDSSRHLPPKALPPPETAQKVPRLLHWPESVLDTATAQSPSSVYGRCNDGVYGPEEWLSAVTRRLSRTSMQVALYRLGSTSTIPAEEQRKPAKGC